MIILCDGDVKQNAASNENNSVFCRIPFFCVVFFLPLAICGFFVGFFAFFGGGNYSVIIFIISLSVSFIPREARRLTEAMVLSTPFFTMPSPLTNSCPLRYIL